MSNWITRCSLICFCRMFVTSWSKDLFLSKKRQFLIISSIDTAWDFSREQWSDLITFESILILESLIVFLCLKYLVQLSKWRFELGVCEVAYFSRRLSSFCYTFTYFVSFGVIENRVTKVNFKYFNGHFVEAWLFEKFIFKLDASSYSLKITCILSRQAIYLKKMMVSSAKITVLISWSPICILLILLLTLMKLARTSAAIMYKSVENRHPWQTSRVRAKGSESRSFILILDWILVYTSLTMWMNLFPCPNLCKAVKLKSQPTLRILQKDFYSVYLTHQLCSI